MGGTEDLINIAGDPYPRLPLLDTTIKQLFALSGNRCAYSGCMRSIISETGQVIAQIAHIKGVKPGTARFDENMSPNDRRHPDNLMILCYEHHKVTDDETVYTVERMRKMKSAHENRYGGIVTGLRSTVEDVTHGTAVRFPSTFEAYGRLYDWDVVADPSTIEVIRTELIAFIDVLSRLTPDIRSVLCAVMDRGTQVSDNQFEVTAAELKEILDIDEVRLADLLGVLTRYELAHFAEPEYREGYGPNVVWVETNRRAGLERDNLLLSEIHEVATRLGVRLETLIVDLDWSCFD